MPPEPSAPKEYLTLYRDGSLGTALIEAIGELIIAGRFPIVPGAAPQNPINLTSEPTGSEAADPIDLTTDTTTTRNTSSPTSSTNTNISTSTSNSNSNSTTNTTTLSSPPEQPDPQQQQDLAPLTQKLTNHLLTTFDRVIAQTLTTHDEVVKKTPAIKIKGRLKQYRLVDDIWRFWVEDAEVVVGPARRRRGRGGGTGKSEAGGKRKRDGDADGDVDGERGHGGEERAGKRRRGDGGEARIVDGEKGEEKEEAGNGYRGGPKVIKVNKLLIVACDGRGEGSGEGKRKKRGG